MSRFDTKFFSQLKDDIEDGLGRMDTDAAKRAVEDQLKQLEEALVSPGQIVEHPPHEDYWLQHFFAAALTGVSARVPSPSPSSVAVEAMQIARAALAVYQETIEEIHNGG